MKKRILAVLLCCAMLLGILPIFAQASDVPAGDSLGTVYLSISDDAKYVEGNDDAGTIMAYVPISLDEVAKIKLEDYNLSKYIVLDKEGNETVTLLHVFLYALKNYYGSTDGKALTTSGGPGSMFMTAFWGHDCNLTYYVNAEYPEASPGWGATADIITLKSGDFIDISMYTSWTFYSDAAAGYHYFLDADGKITHDYTTDITQALPISYGRTWGGMGGKTETVPETTGTLYYSKTFYDKNAQSVTVDAEGKAQITFPSDGTWYLWADGSYGKSAGNEETIVSAPAYAKVIVKNAAQVVADMINALPTTADLTLADKDAVAAAREALAALTEAQLAYISDETLALLEKAEAKLAVLEGTVYISISDDEKYVEGNDDAGTIMAYVPVSLQEVAKIKLEDYDLSKYIVPDDEGNETVTVLHLFLYALKNFYGSVDEKAFTASGAPGSLFMTAFWGHDCNLTYYVNGTYPLAKPDWGATADIIPLKAGDFVDLSMYTSWEFFSDEVAGYHYFLDADGNITHDFTTDISQALSISYGRTWNGMGGKTVTVAEDTGTLYYSKTFYDKDAKSVTVDAEGKAQITFPSDGTWYLWADGGCSKTPGKEDTVVSAPAYAKVIVTIKDENRKAAQVVIDLIEALPGVEDLTLADKDAVVAAREALSALTEAQLFFISEEMTAKLASAEDGIAKLEVEADKTAAAEVVALINALPSAANLTLADKDAVAAAREALSALTEAQLAYISAETLALLEKAEAKLAALEKPIPFTDLTQDWYQESVAYVYRNNLMYGTTNTTFSPDANLTRAMFAAMLYRLAGSPRVVGTCPFPDVPSTAYYLDAVIWGEKNGVIYGEGGKFNPDGKITREQMAAMMRRYADFCELKTDARADLSGFTDAAAVSSWALNDMKWAVAEHLLYGDTNSRLNPTNNATRAEAAAILQRFATRLAK